MEDEEIEEIEMDGDCQSEHSAVDETSGENDGADRRNGDEDLEDELFGAGGDESDGDVDSNVDEDDFIEDLYEP
jgi:hypothetical protein